MLLLWQRLRGRGGVLGRRGAVQRRGGRCDGRGEREGRDRGRGGDHGHHGDDGDRDLRRREGREREGGWLVRRQRLLLLLLAVSVIAPGDVIGSDWLSERGHKFHAL